MGIGRPDILVSLADHTPLTHDHMRVTITDKKTKDVYGGPVGGK